jgi:hypothetical protein
VPAPSVTLPVHPTVKAFERALSEVPFPITNKYCPLSSQLDEVKVESELAVLHL